MSKTITVSVTQEHIDGGCKRSGHRCPIALAILEAVRASHTKDNMVRVSFSKVFVFGVKDGEFESLMYRLPHEGKLLLLMHGESRMGIRHPGSL